MKIVFFIITIIYIYIIIRNLIYYSSAKNALKLRVQNMNRNDSHIFLIVPVTGKKRDIIDTLNHFFEMSRFMKVITFVVASNENSETLNNYDIASKIVANKHMESSILVIPYPSNTDCLAEYYNYAINYIRQYDKSDYIVGLYEEDVILSTTEVNYVRENMEPNTIIKQYCCYKDLTKNKLLNGLIYDRNRELVINAIGRNHYNANCRLHKKGYIKLSGTSMTANGLFANYSTLEQMGFIPTDVNEPDKFLGIMSNYLKYNIITMPSIIGLKTPDGVNKISSRFRNEFVSLMKGITYNNKIVNRVGNGRYTRNIDVKNSSDYRTLSYISYNLLFRGFGYVLSSIVGVILYLICAVSSYGLSGFGVSLVLLFMYFYMFNILSTMFLNSNTDMKYKHKFNYFPILTNLFRFILCLKEDDNGKK